MLPQNLIPVLRHAINELLELRFREKTIGVEINGRPWQEPCAPLVFPFEPFTLEIIFQNILSNAMRQGDLDRRWAAVPALFPAPLICPKRMTNLR